MRLSWDLVLVPLVVLVKYVGGVAIDNGVADQPTITCGTDEISFWVKTQNPFEGKTYVKGEYGKGECSQTFTGGGTGELKSTTTRGPDVCPPCPDCISQRFGRKKRQSKEDDPLMAHLTVQLGTCNVRRDRSLSPAGVTITFTVVVSFHPNFITKVDRAYQIRCL